MKLKEIQGFADYLKCAKDIYEYSFPPEERLDFEKVLERDDSRYKMQIVTDNESPVGILFYWDFEDFIYIEHLAFSLEQRGKGWGSIVLKEFIANNQKIIVLEIEMPENHEAQRRLVFYERLGFVKSDFPYIQPPYSEGKSSIEMLIMSTKSLSKKEFDKVKDILYTDMYKVKY